MELYIEMNIGVNILFGERRIKFLGKILLVYVVFLDFLKIKILYIGF